MDIQGSVKRFRERQVADAEKEGVRYVEETLLYYPFSHWHFAQETKDYSLDVREETQEFLESYGISNDVSEDLAQMIGWDALNEARRAGMQRLFKAGDSDVDIPSESWGWEDWEQDYFRAYDVVDSLTHFDQLSGLRSLINVPENTSSELPYETSSLEGRIRESHMAIEDKPLSNQEVGFLNIKGVYVLVDDWIDYIQGEKPLSIGDRAYDIAVDIGVGT